MQLAMPNVTFGIGFQMPARHQPKTLPNFVLETYHKEKNSWHTTSLQLAMQACSWQCLMPPSERLPNAGAASPKTPQFQAQNVPRFKKRNFQTSL